MWLYRIGSSPMFQTDFHFVVIENNEAVCVLEARSFFYAWGDYTTGQENKFSYAPLI